MLGVLPVPFDFEVDYTISTEELLIRTEAFINSVPRKPGLFGRYHGLTQAFRCHISGEILDRTAWYWSVSEILHNLSINVTGGFSRLDDIESQEVSRILSDFVCWILAAYGIDLFPTVPHEDTTGLSTKLTSQDVPGFSDRTFILKWIYNGHGYTYHLRLEHKPTHPYFSDMLYAMTVLESLECQKLLRAYNEDVHLLIKIQRGFVGQRDGSSRDPRTYSDPSLPFQVRRAVFANLLAHLFVSKIEEGNRDRRPERSTLLGDFLLEGDLKGTEVDSFLLKSLFRRYRVAFEEDQHAAEHPTALEKTDIAVFKRLDSPEVPDGLEKVWSAYLYRNE